MFVKDEEAAPFDVDSCGEVDSVGDTDGSG